MILNEIEIALEKKYWTLKGKTNKEQVVQRRSFFEERKTFETHLLRSNAS